MDRTTRTERVNSTGEDEWNMNVGWINYLNDLLITYGQCALHDDYNGMYKCLNLIENTISPKVDKDETETNLKQIKRNVRSMIIRDSQGRIKKYYPQLIEETEDLLDKTYCLIIIKMDEAGILTRQPKDPGAAFGNFRGS